MLFDIAGDEFIGNLDPLMELLHSLRFALTGEVLEDKIDPKI